MFWISFGSPVFSSIAHTAMLFSPREDTFLPWISVVLALRLPGKRTGRSVARDRARTLSGVDNLRIGERILHEERSRLSVLSAARHKP